MTDMISVVAQAIYDADGGDSEELAKAAIEAHEKALEAQGLVIVPREPNEAMIEAGYGRPVFDDEVKANMVAIWQAMLAALEGKDAD